ncbi:unnamed protein product, partial [marine sediment metagenome]
GVGWVDDVYDAVTVNATNDTIAPTTAPDASKDYKFLVNVV